MVTVVAQAVGTQVECRKCHRIIAEWDGIRLIIRRARVYVEIPGPVAVIDCHHWTTAGRPCNARNQVNCSA